MASGELLTCLIQLCHTTVLTSHSVVVSLGCGEGTDGGTAQQTVMRFNGDSSLFLHQTTRNFFLSFVASWHAQLTCHPCKLCKPYKCGNQCKHQGLPMNAAVFTHVWTQFYMALSVLFAQEILSHKGQHFAKHWSGCYFPHICDEIGKLRKNNLLTNQRLQMAGMPCMCECVCACVHMCMCECVCAV